MFEQWREDVAAVMARDPAARSRLEVLLCYPGLRAIRAHRRAHRAYLKGHITWARIISQRARHKTGIEIHPGAVLFGLMTFLACRLAEKRFEQVDL